MRTADYDTKQRPRATHPRDLGSRECQPTHRLYKGLTCPECELAIPVGPYTPAQLIEVFGQALYTGARRADEPSPAAAANPITEKETQLRAAHAAATKRYNEAIWELSRVDNGLVRRERYQEQAPAGTDQDDHEAALTELKIAETEVERLNRAVRIEAGARAGRIRSWLSRTGNSG